ncbi:unnamed protein product [Rotaria sp. Silwood1]|nr:unnamed protein product [Rotaria sp. Silwood1]CAF3374741.1 unnamed protein product [Rotaria sp. Silwood1]CAF4674989.1 unnamed protein product [Rotaria sp. Silwood1]
MIPSKVNALKVNFNIALDLSLCHFNYTIQKTSHYQLNNTKDILIIQLSYDCSLIQQLATLKNLDWTQNYFAIIFSINHDNKKFEHTLLSYIDNQIKSSISMLNHSKYSWSFEFPLYRNLNDYSLNQTNIGFIDANEVKHLNNILANQTNFLLYRINRDNIQFDPCIFIFISIIIICMLVGNEWHRRVYMKKILNHYDNYKSKTNKFKYGLIVGLSLLISFLLLYIIDQYCTFIIGYRNAMIINPEFPMIIWKLNGDNRNWIDVEFIQHLYINMFENSGLDCLLSGGSMNFLKINAMKWIIKENIPFVFNFSRLIRNNDDCDFHAGRIYLSIDDIIFPSLLINFCRLFDIGNNIHSRIYYIQVLISYTVALFLSYVIMIITKRDQLSSIVIYPFIVLSTILTGVIRGECRKLLKGTLTTFEERQMGSEPLWLSGMT